MPKIDQSEHAKGAVISIRLASLDAYRGFVMMVLATEGYIPHLAEKFPDSGFWQIMGRQFVHVPWEGGGFWDLIQPSFMFIVGVAIAYSYHSRCAKGETRWRIAEHALYRSLVLIGLGLFLISMPYQQTNFEFTDILAQIGLAYPFAYLLVGKRPPVQLSVAAIILIAWWLAFYLYPLPPSDFDYSSLGIRDVGDRLQGLYGHWNRYTNFGEAFDRWFLNLFHRPEPFVYYPFGGTTLTFIPGVVTLLFGIMAGELLRGPRQPFEKFLRLTAAGVICVFLGLALGYTVCPIIKAIWTSSWALACAGFTFWFFAVFYWIVDNKRWTRFTFPFVVVGTNALAMYMMIRLIREWLWKSVAIHFLNLSKIPFFWSIEAATVTLIMWLACLWMYRRKIFIRL